MGEAAYLRCMKYRIIAGAFEGVTVFNYVIYFFYPLPLSIPLILPWTWHVSILIAILILILSVYLMVIGMRDAGRETLEPKKEHTLYGGVYETIRHHHLLSSG